MKKPNKPLQNANGSSAPPAVDSIAKTSQLSASAPEFVPTGMSQYEVSTVFTLTAMSESDPVSFSVIQKIRRVSDTIKAFCFSIIFFPLISSQDQSFYDDDSENYYGEPTLADIVSDVLGHLSSSPGSFETDIEDITAMLNSWVTTEESLHELVELIFTQVGCHVTDN